MLNQRLILEHVSDHVCLCVSHYWCVLINSELIHVANPRGSLWGTGAHDCPAFLMIWSFLQKTETYVHNKGAISTIPLVNPTDAFDSAVILLDGDSFMSFIMQYRIR